MALSSSSDNNSYFLGAGFWVFFFISLHLTVVCFSQTDHSGRFSTQNIRHGVNFAFQRYQAAHADFVVAVAIICPNHLLRPLKLLSEFKHYAMFEIICTAFIWVACKVHPAMMLRSLNQGHTLSVSEALSCVFLYSLSMPEASSSKRTLTDLPFTLPRDNLATASRAISRATAT
jgi:hypothetical protein